MIGSVWVVMVSVMNGDSWIDKVFSNRGSAVAYIERNQEFLDYDEFFDIEEHSVY